MVTLCPITDAEIDLFDSTTLINAAYEEPTTVPRTWLLIGAYAGVTRCELNRHYISKSYKDNFLWSTISTAEMKLNDSHPTHDNLPCSFVDGQKIVIRDWNGIRVLWYGFVRGTPDHEPYGQMRANGTYRTITTVEMQDAWSLMESRPYKANYPAGTPAGAVLKGAFAQAGFDTSQIDATAGKDVGPFDVDDQYPSEIAEQMMSLLDWTYWFDIQVATDDLLPIPYCGPKESALVRVPYDITETNWHWVFDPKRFKLKPAQEDYANEVWYTFPRIYSIGQATFQNGSDVMIGYTGNEKWSLINIADARSSLTVEIPSTGATYTLNKNNSDSTGVNEFLISPVYAQADSALITAVASTSQFTVGSGGDDFYAGYAVKVFSGAYPAGETRIVSNVTGKPAGPFVVSLTSPLPSAPNIGDNVAIEGIDYIIKGSNFTIIRNNKIEINRTKAIRGGDGIRTKKIVRTDVAQTYEQAAVVATFEVALYSRQYFRGDGFITTSWNGIPSEGRADWLLFWVGKTLSVNLPKSKKVIAMLRIEGMSRQEIGGIQKFPDGAWSPAFSNQLQFTPSLYEDTEQIRALFKATRKIASSSSSGSVNMFDESVVAMKDCFHLVSPISSESVVEVYDSVTLIPPPDPVVTIITSGTSWTVPADWNNANNQVEVIGAGAGGTTWATESSVGGGAGAYSSVSNITLTPSGSVTIQVGAGGAADTSGTDTWFDGATLAASQVGAKAGLVGSHPTGGVGGAAASGVGTTKYSGGNGGTESGGSYAGASGGGGAAGPHGNGAHGGNVAAGGSGDGSGGGGADGGFDGTFGIGAHGGDNRNSTGGGAPLSPPFDGGGGAPGFVDFFSSGSGQNGASGEVLWTDTTTSNTAGPGGGGGGGAGGVGTGGNGGNGGLYGSGGGGAGAAGGTPGTGSNGVIIVTYTPTL